MRLRTELLVLLATFAAATGLAELLGAANLGTALSFGQIGFVIALIVIMARG